MNASLLQKMASDPAEFLRRVLIETDSGAQPWATVTDPWQRDDVNGILPSLKRLVCADAPEPVICRAWWERPRGHAKTSDFALLLLWVLLFSRRRRRAVWCGADQDQGLLGLEACRVIIAHNPWMDRLLSIHSDRIINEHTGSVCQFVTSDAPSAYGETPDITLADELCYWRAPDLWHAIFSAAGKRRDSVLMVGTNAGQRGTWQWELRVAVAEDSAWHFSTLPGPVASWINPQRLAEQERLLPRIVFARLWLNRWSDAGGGDALSEEDISRAVVLPGPMDGKAFGWKYVGGLDLSTRRNFSALVIVAKHVGGCRRILASGEREPVSRLAKVLADIGPLIGHDLQPMPSGPQFDVEEIPATNKLRLAWVKLWRPERGQVDLGEIEQAVLDLHRRFGLSSLAFDPWQGEYLAQRLRKAGVRTEAINFTGGTLQTMAAETLAVFRENRIAVYDDPQLLADLRELSIVERQYGFRLQSPRSKGCGHGDCATAFCLALLAAKRSKRIGPAVLHGRPMVLTPGG